jgi:hypothetical protein
MSTVYEGQLPSYAAISMPYFDTTGTLQYWSTKANTTEPGNYAGTFPPVPFDGSVMNRHALRLAMLSLVWYKICAANVTQAQANPAMGSGFGSVGWG